MSEAQDNDEETIRDMFFSTLGNTYKIEFK